MMWLTMLLCVLACAHDCTALTCPLYQGPNMPQAFNWTDTCRGNFCVRVQSPNVTIYGCLNRKFVPHIENGCVRMQDSTVCQCNTDHCTTTTLPISMPSGKIQCYDSSVERNPIIQAPLCTSIERTFESDYNNAFNHQRGTQEFPSFSPFMVDLRQNSYFCAETYSSYPKLSDIRRDKFCFCNTNLCNRDKLPIKASRYPLIRCYHGHSELHGKANEQGRECRGHFCLSYWTTDKSDSFWRQSCVNVTDYATFRPHLGTTKFCQGDSHAAHSVCATPLCNAVPAAQKNVEKSLEKLACINSLKLS